MPWHIDFRNDLDAHCSRFFYERFEFSLGEGAIGCREPRQRGFQAEGASRGFKLECVGGCFDTRVVVQPDIVVGEVQLQIIQFIVGAELDECFNRGVRKRFATTVKHEPTHRILWPINCRAAGEGVGLLVENLQKRACTPKGTQRRRGSNRNGIGRDFQTITLWIFQYARLHLEANVTGLGRDFRRDARSL